MRNLLSVAAAAFLMFGSVANAAVPVRAAAPLDHPNEMSGRIPLSAIIVLLSVLAGAIYLLADGNNAPDSP